MTELTAVAWAINLAKEHRWRAVKIEGDARLVIEALNGRRAGGLHSQTLINNIKSMLSFFTSISFSFCYRECNEVANRLARWATSNKCNLVWPRSGPLWIEDLVLADILP